MKARAAALARSTGGRAATMRQVAQASGVSLKTVSRVVNDEPAVHAVTRERVQAAIDALGYRPDPLARGLRGAAPRALGLVYDNPNAHYVVSLQDGVLSACRERGYGLQIHPCDAKAPGLAALLLEMAQGARLAGLVLAPPMSEQAALAAALARGGLPVVRIVSGAEVVTPGSSTGPRSRASPAALDCVRVDDRSAARAITTHLLQLGHRRIGFLWGDAGHGSSVQRYRGYLDTLTDHGLAADPRLIVEGTYSFESGFRNASKLLAAKSPPSAIFASNDEIAAGALAAARAAGLDVPWDVSIAGFEDSPFARQAWPALTTARQSAAELGRCAALQLIERLRTPPEPAASAAARAPFVPELVVRASTGPAPRSRRVDAGQAAIA